MIFCLGRHGDVYCYHMSSKKFRRLQKFPENRQPGELTVFDNVVYATGGSHTVGMLNRVYSNDMYSYSTDGGKWTKLAPMFHARSKHSAVFLQAKLYIIGGKNLEVSVDGLERSVECYDPVTNAWSHRTSTIEGRINSSAAASTKYIYVMGGENVNGGIRGVNTVERYCCRKDLWEKMPNLNRQRISSSAVYFNEKIFVFGGSNGIFELNSFEFMDASEKRWTVVSIPYTTPLSIALNMDDKILALGASTWGDDLVLQYSFVRRRGVHWKHIKEFIHQSHRIKSFKYAVIKMLNYEIDKIPEAQCDCNYFDADSSVDEEDDLMSTSSDMSEDLEDDAGWMELDPFGLWM